MGKSCVACGFAMEDPQKPTAETEDCPNCGGEGTVQEDASDDAGKEEAAPVDADDAWDA